MRARVRWSARTSAALAVVVGLSVFAWQRWPWFARAESTDAPADRVFETLVCSQANWRIAPPADIERVVLPVSHILIRHAESEALQAPLVVPDWYVLPPPPNRSKEAALKLVRGLEGQFARGRVLSFEEMARQHSEDTLTAPFGGALGMLAASDLMVWPEVLDALSRTEPGSVSEVVETQWGFHLFLRHALPPAEAVSARRIVIGHADAPWLEFVEREDRARRPWRQRSSDAAFQIASRLASELRQSPQRFEALLQEQSDHWDVAQGGDIGSWTTHDVGHHARSLGLLARAAEGEIVGPISTPQGWAVWQRTPATPRRSFAMRALRFSYEPHIPAGEPGSKVSAERLARETLATLVIQAHRFAEFEATWGRQPESFTEGRGRRGVERALGRTRMNDIADDIVDADWAFMILRRVEPGELPRALPRLTDLPAPDRAPVEYHLARLPDEGRELLISDVALTCRLRDSLPKNAIQAFRSAVSSLGSDLGNTIVEGERLALAETFLNGLADLVGPERFECLEQELDLALRMGFAL